LALVGENYCPVDAGRRIKPAKRGVFLDVYGRCGKIYPRAVEANRGNLGVNQWLNLRMQYLHGE
jgi:hypothetical protein